MMMMIVKVTFDTTGRQPTAEKYGLNWHSWISDAQWQIKEVVMFLHCTKSL